MRDAEINVSLVAYFGTFLNLAPNGFRSVQISLLEKGPGSLDLQLSVTDYVEVEIFVVCYAGTLVSGSRARPSCMAGLVSPGAWCFGA